MSVLLILGIPCNLLFVYSGKRIDRTDRIKSTLRASSFLFNTYEKVCCDEWYMAFRCDIVDRPAPEGSLESKISLKNLGSVFRVASTRGLCILTRAFNIY